MTEADVNRAPDGNTAVAVPAREVSLRRNRDFMAVLIGQGLAALGDAVSVTALPLLVLALTGSGFQMGVVGLLQSLPDLLFGIPVGALADRWDRRRVMFLADIGRAVLTATIPISFALGLPTMTIILVVTFPIHLLRVFHMAAFTASVPALVARRQIAAATSATEALYSMGFIVGPAVAGLLAAAIGPAPTITLQVASLSVSALAILLVRRSLRAEPSGTTRDLAAEIREGVGFVVGHPSLRAAVLVWGLLNMITAPTVASLTYFLLRDLDLGDASVGAAVAAFGIGSLGGSAIAARIVRGRIGRLLLACIALTGLLTAILSTAPTLPPVLLAAVLLGASNVVIFVSYASYRATVTPDRLLGRVGSLGRTLSFGLQPIGFIIGGLLLDLAGGSTTLLVMGLATVTLAGLFSFSAPLRWARLDRGVADAA